MAARKKTAKRGTKSTSRRTAGKTVKKVASGMPRSPKQWGMELARRDARRPGFIREVMASVSSGGVPTKWVEESAIDTH